MKHRQRYVTFGGMDNGWAIIKIFSTIELLEIFLATRPAWRGPGGWWENLNIFSHIHSQRRGRLTVYNLVQGDTALNHHFFVRGVLNPLFLRTLLMVCLFFACCFFWRKFSTDRDFKYFYMRQPLCLFKPFSAEEHCNLRAVAEPGASAACFLLITTVHYHHHSARRQEVLRTQYSIPHILYKGH